MHFKRVVSSLHMFEKQSMLMLILSNCPIPDIYDQKNLSEYQTVSTFMYIIKINFVITNIQIMHVILSTFHLYWLLLFPKNYR